MPSAPVTANVRFERPPAMSSNRNGATAPSMLRTSQSVTGTSSIPEAAVGMGANRNPEVAALAKSLFGDPSASAAGDSLAAFAPALAKLGDPARGSAVFERLCQSCHRVGDRGHAVGPDLTATQFAEPEALLSHILDPNRYVAPNHVQHHQLRAGLL